jgi:hypothetical protein
MDTEKIVRSNYPEFCWARHSSLESFGCRRTNRPCRAFAGTPYASLTSLPVRKGTGEALRPFFEHLQSLYIFRRIHAFNHNQCLFDHLLDSYKFIALVGIASELLIIPPSIKKVPGHIGFVQQRRSTLTLVIAVKGHDESKWIGLGLRRITCNPHRSRRSGCRRSEPPNSRAGIVGSTPYEMRDQLNINQLESKTLSLAWK